MTLEEKVQKTLTELVVSDAAGVEALFAEVRAALEGERHAIRSEVAARGSKGGENRWKALRDRWLSRKSGLLSLIDEHWLKPATREFKPLVGRAFNALRKEADELGGLADLARAIQRTPDLLDLTLPGYRRPLGSIHPITRVQREIEEIFLGLGFRIESGPEVETVYYNFDALNIPEDHPARDDMDTLYVDARSVLRTHTSPVQIRAMEKYGAPLYIIVPGRVYRRDNPDSTHSPMFHQIEGLAVDTDITFGDLKGTLDYFAKRFFGEKVRTRFDPTFFPFTEPSGQMSVSCWVCGGSGCGVCKQGGWVELLGCGMVHPQVLRNGGIDPERYSGWAFGFGIDRMAMIKYDINDIQLFFQSDVRFLEQF